MAAGSLLCLFALLIRYPVAMGGPLARRFKLRWEYVSWIWQALPMRHPRYLGLIAEAAGLAGILGSGLGVATAGFILIPAILLSVRLEERRVLADYPRSGLEYDQRESAVLRPPLSVAACLLLVPGFLYLAVAFSTRELVLFHSSQETAQVLLLSMAGAQGTWAILALSLSLVLMQIIASNYSANLAQMAALRWPFVIGLALLGSSILYDVIVVARIDDWVGLHRARGEELVDAAFLLCVVSLAGVALAAFESTRQVTTERIMRRLLQRFDARWLQRVTNEWPSRVGQWQVDIDDPMRGVETVLRSHMNSGDLGSTRIVLLGLREALDTAIRPQRRDNPKLWVSLDAYLSSYTGSLVAATAKQVDEAGIQQWMSFVRLMMEDASMDVASLKRDTFYLSEDSPPGEFLLRRIISAAVSNAHVGVAGQGIWAVTARAEKLIGILPADADLLVYGGQLGSLRDLSKEEEERRRENDYLIEALEQRYLSYLRQQGELAVGAGYQVLAWQASHCLSQLLERILALPKQSAWMRRLLVNHALYELEQVADYACESRVARAFTLSGLGLSLGKLDRDDDDRDILSGISLWTGRMVGKLARHGVLEYSTVVDAAMVGLQAQESGVENSGHVLASLVDALDLLLGNWTRERNEKHRLVIQELFSRIGQLAPSAKGELAENAMSRMSEVQKRYDEWRLAL
jgi:protein-S-isoprenylcysteine O-methyltransferase Ste14